MVAYISEINADNFGSPAALGESEPHAQTGSGEIINGVCEAPTPLALKISGVDDV